jgi:hypothetical protein
MKDLYGAKTTIHQASYERNEIRPTLRKSHRMSERRKATRFHDPPHTFFQGGLIALYARLRVIGQVPIESLLHARYIALVQKHLREVRSPNLITPVHLRIA